MRVIKLLTVALLCLNFTLINQTDILNQKVSLHYQATSIEKILDNIHKQYGVRFSYLNNEIPEDIKLSISMDNTPLYAALDEILKDTDLSYQVVSGQVVLKKDARKSTEKKVLQENSENAATQKPTQNTKTFHKKTVLTTDTQEEQTVKESEQTQIQENSEDKPLTTGKEKRKPVQPIETSKIESPAHEADALAMNTAPESLSLSQKINRGLEEILFQHLPEESDYEKKPFHIGIIYPLSTNGTQAGQYVNEISLHILVGYAAGLDGFEASGFGNIENDFVEGAQFAGFFNLVKNDVEGIQASGFLNVNGGNMQGAQFAGFLNTAAGELDGIQGAGFANIATGSSKGVQLSGFMNVVADDANMLQGAGFMNVTSGFHDGAQFAGFANIAQSVNGVQLAGFTNVVAGDVDGFQGSGFINIARHVKGIQLGVLNVADSMNGVPIGFLSIVKKNGYRKLEVWGSEALQANIGFKIGVARFYNIFAVGTQFTDATFRWGLGYGIGTQWPSASDFHVNLDLLSYSIYEEGNNFLKNQELNLLNTLRLGFNKQFSDHFSLFVAPTFNVMVSQLQYSEDNFVGSDIAPWTVYDKTFAGRTIKAGSGFQYASTNVKMWPGFQAGIRF